MPLDDAASIVPLGDFRGKALQKIEASCHQGVLDVNLSLEGGYCLELSFHVESRATVSAVQWENGDSRLLRRPSLKRPATKRCR